MPFLSTTSKGDLLLRVHVQPGAKSDGIVGLHGDMLKLRLTAPPVEGRANEAVVRFVAGQLGLGRGDVVLRSGRQSRMKTLLLKRTDEQTIRRRLTELLPGQS